MHRRSFLAALIGAPVARLMPATGFVFPRKNGKANLNFAIHMAQIQMLESRKFQVDEIAQVFVAPPWFANMDSQLAAIERSTRRTWEVGA